CYHLFSSINTKTKNQIMSETNTYQEQPATTETTLPAEQQVHETETPTTVPEQSQETAPVAIGGQVIEKNPDGSITQTVFPVTEVSVEQTAPAQVEQTEQVPATEPIEDAPLPAEEAVTTEPVEAATMEPIFITRDEAPVVMQEQEVQTIAEVGVPKEPAAQAEAVPAKVGVAGSLAIGAAAGATALRKK